VEARGGALVEYFYIFYRPLSEHFHLKGPHSRSINPHGEESVC